MHSNIGSGSSRNNSSSENNSGVTDNHINNDSRGGSGNGSNSSSDNGGRGRHGGTNKGAMAWARLETRNDTFTLLYSSGPINGRIMDDSITLLYKVSAALNVHKRAQNQHEQTDMWPSVQPHLLEQSIFW
jgi:hypothetical protein